MKPVLVDDELAQILAPHAKARGLVRVLGMGVTLAQRLRLPMFVTARMALLMVRVRQAAIDRALARAGYPRRREGAI